jgi:hypothetical protein
MKKDFLQQFVAARQQLERERAELHTRVLEIDRILGGANLSAPVGRSGRSHSNGVAAPRLSRRGRGSNAMSMRDAASQVLRSGPKDIRQLLDGLHKVGYRFTSTNPKNSLAVMLYTNKKLFNGKRGMFSLK